MLIRRRRHHRRQEVTELNVTAFMNLMVILVPFLLITAVFSRLAIVELQLPVADQSAPENQEERTKLQLYVFDDAFEIADQYSQLARIEHGGNPDYPALHREMLKIKTRLGNDHKDITLLMKPDTEYGVIIGVMDAVRETVVLRDGEKRRAELFPQIAFGDFSEETTIPAGNEASRIPASSTTAPVDAANNPAASP